MLRPVARACTRPPPGATVKVAYLLTRSDTVGGAAVHVRDCALEMIEHGEEAAVVVGGDGPLVGDLRERGIPVRTVPHLVGHPFHLWTWPRATWGIRSHLVDLQPDLVSCHTSNAGFLGRLAAVSLGIPAIFTAHSWAFTEGKSRFRQAVFTAGERVAAPLAERIIAVSQYDRRLALERGVGSEEKVVTVHNGVRDVGEDLRAAPGEEPPVLVSVARFERQKDHPVLLRALAAVADRRWTLTLVGDGPRTEVMRRLASELGLGDRVDFAGYRADVPEILAGAQAFVLASRWEGFPRSVLEAMRAGLPVAASDVGGVSESVADGRTGFVVPAGDEETLAGRLAELLDDPGLRQRMGRRGRLRYEERFTFRRMFERTRRIYADVLRASTSVGHARRI